MGSFIVQYAILFVFGLGVSYKALQASDDAIIAVNDNQDKKIDKAEVERETLESAVQAVDA